MFLSTISDPQKRKAKMRKKYLSQTVIQILIPVLCFSQTKIFAADDMQPIYGYGQSLIGVVRGWNPSRFYMLDPEFRKHINKVDRELLESRKLFYFLSIEKKLQEFVISDTTIKINLNAKDLPTKRRPVF